MASGGTSSSDNGAPAACTTSTGKTAPAPVQTAGQMAPPGLQLMTTTTPADVEHGHQAGWGGESLSAAHPPPVPVGP